MAMENIEVETITFDEEDVEVYLEGEVVSALEKIERLRKKNQVPKELLNKDIVELNEPFLLQIEKGKKIKESINQQLNVKNQGCERLWGEIFLLKKDLEKEKTQLSFNKENGKGTDNLNDLLEAQRVSTIRTGLVFEANEHNRRIKRKETNYLCANNKR